MTAFFTTRRYDFIYIPIPWKKRSFLQKVIFWRKFHISKTVERLYGTEEYNTATLEEVIFTSPSDFSIEINDKTKTT